MLADKKHVRKEGLRVIRVSGDEDNRHLVGRVGTVHITNYTPITGTVTVVYDATGDLPECEDPTAWPEDFAPYTP